MGAEDSNAAPSAAVPAPAASSVVPAPPSHPSQEPPPVDEAAAKVEAAPPSASDTELQDTITLERADFRQLVVALRNLRQQRQEDLETIHGMKQALATVCQLALKNDHKALREYVATDIVGQHLA